MRRFAVTIALFAVVAAVVPAATRGDFDRVVDFSVTLKSLAAAAAGAQALPTGRMAVLTGTVKSVTIVNKDEATFQVRIELITGEWMGTDDVVAYSSYIDFSGSEYFKVFPARAPASPPPGVVVQSARVLVVGRPVSITLTPSGDRKVLLEGIDIRVIQ
jgi:hypothetical protein